MRAVIQLVSQADVLVDGTATGTIEKGLCVLVGFEEEDTIEDMDWIIRKICAMRIFSDGQKMNLSVEDVEGQILIVSQFTLHASTKKGNRPSFIKAAKPNSAKLLYNEFVKRIKRQSPVPVAFGKFGAQMELRLVNNGPVTIIMDSKNKA